MPRKRKPPSKAPKDPDGLQAMQRRFVDEYLVDLNASAAAKRAGYSARTAESQGARLLGNVKVAAVIAKAQAAVSERTEITQDWVIARLKDNHDRAMSAEPVLDREGNPIGEYTYNGAVANKSLELIGKHIGMWKDKLDVNVKGPPFKIYAGFSPDDV